MATTMPTFHLNFPTRNFKRIYTGTLSCTRLKLRTDDSMRARQNAKQNEKPVQNFHMHLAVRMSYYCVIINTG